MGEMLLNGLLLGGVVGLGYYGIVYALEWLRVARLRKKMKGP